MIHLVQSSRDALSEPNQKQGSHPGLILQKYLSHYEENGTKKRDLLEKARAAIVKAAAVYPAVYSRYRETLKGSVSHMFEVNGRMVIGLGTSSVLETGILLHHTFAVPYIPGSALKGLTSHYCQELWGDDPDFAIGGVYYNTLFGSTEDAGHIVFHDAYPDPETVEKSLNLDVMTVHHREYYESGKGNEGGVSVAKAPTDFDDPNPIPFLSVTGKFWIALSSDVENEDGRKWTELAMKLLTEALFNWGIGGKTSSGYGRLKVKAGG